MHCASDCPPTRTLPLCVLRKKASQTCIHTLCWREGEKPPCQHTWEHVTAAQPRPEGLTAAELHAHMYHRPLYTAEPKFQGLQCVFTKETVAWGKQGNGVYRPRPGCPPEQSRHHQCLCMCQYDIHDLGYKYMYYFYDGVAPILSKYMYMYMNNHVHSAPQLERKKEKNREERKKNHTL